MKSQPSDVRGNLKRSPISIATKRKVQSVLTRIPPVPLRSRRRVVVLAYHSVRPDPSDQGTKPASLEAHLRWVSANCEIVPLDAVPALARQGDRTRPAVAVTFDDGFADNHEYAYPILRRFGVQATFFVATGLIDRDPFVVQKGWEGWKDEGSTLTWDQAREMQHGGMSFGAHGHSHANLARLDDETALAELEKSKRILEDHLEQRISSVAYPLGRPRRHVSVRTLELAAMAGYELGAMVLHRRVLSSDAELGIPRFVINDDTVQTLRAKVLGSFDAMGVWQERAPLWAVRLVAGRHFVG